MPSQVTLGDLVPSMLADLEESAESIRAKCVQAVADTTEEMKEAAKSGAPISPGSGKGGHHLRDSLEVTPSKRNDGLSARFYVSAKKWRKYGIVHLLELGHLKPYGRGYVPAKPFMKPALERYRPILDQRIDEILESSKPQ